jgi:hypothetical protein
LWPASTQAKAPHTIRKKPRQKLRRIIRVLDVQGQAALEPLANRANRARLTTCAAR